MLEAPTQPEPPLQGLKLTGRLLVGGNEREADPQGGVEAGRTQLQRTLGQKLHMLPGRVDHDRSSHATPKEFTAAHELSGEPEQKGVAGITFATNQNAERAEAPKSVPAGTSLERAKGGRVEIGAGEEGGVKHELPGLEVVEALGGGGLEILEVVEAILDGLDGLFVTGDAGGERELDRPEAARPVGLGTRDERLDLILGKEPPQPFAEAIDQEVGQGTLTRRRTLQPGEMGVEGGDHALETRILVLEGGNVTVPQTVGDRCGGGGEPSEEGEGHEDPHKKGLHVSTPGTEGLLALDLGRRSGLGLQHLHGQAAEDGATPHGSAACFAIGGREATDQALFRPLGRGGQGDDAHALGLGGLGLLPSDEQSSHALLAVRGLLPLGGRLAALVSHFQRKRVPIELHGANRSALGRLGKTACDQTLDGLVHPGHDQLAVSLQLGIGGRVRNDRDTPSLLLGRGEREGGALGVRDAAEQAQDHGDATHDRFPFCRFSRPAFLQLMVERPGAHV